MDKLEQLHQLLQSKGLDNKTFEEFKANFGDNPEKQKQLHSFLVSKQMDNKSFEEFQSNFFTPLKKKEDSTLETETTDGLPTPTSLDSSEKTDEEEAFKTFLRVNYPELNTEYTSLQEELGTLPMISNRSGQVQKRIDEIKSYVNQSVEDASQLGPNIYAQDYINNRLKVNEIKSNLFEIEKKYDEVSKRTDLSFEELISNDGTYQDLKNQQGLYESFNEDYDKALEDISKDTGGKTGTKDFMHTITGLFNIDTENATEITKMEEELRLEILKNLGSDKEMQKAAGGYMTLEEKEEIIAMSKMSLFSRKYQDAQKVLDNPDATTEEKVQARNELSNSFLDLGISITDGKMNVSPAFKKTIESKKFKEMASENPILDTISTFVGAATKLALQRFVQFPAEIMAAGMNYFFYEDDEYSPADAFIDSFSRFTNFNYVPSSEEKGLLVNENGEFEFSGYGAAKGVAEALPFTLGLLAGMKSGKFKLPKNNMITKMFSRYKNPQKQYERYKLVTESYKLALSGSMEEARDLGLDKGDAVLYGNSVALMEGVTGLIMPDTKYFKTVAGKGALKSFKDNLKKAASKKARYKAIQEFFTNIGKEIGEEEAMLAYQDIAKTVALTDHELFSDITDIAQQKQLLTVTVGLSGSLGAVKIPSSIKQNRKKIYNDIKANADVLSAMISDEIDMFPEKKEDLTKVNNYIANVKKAVETSPENVTPEQIELLTQKIELQKEMESVDDSFKGPIQDKIDNINKQIADAVQEQETRDIPDDKPAEGVQEVEEEVRVAPEEEAEVETTTTKEGEIELFHSTSENFTDFNVMGMTDGKVESPLNELGIHLGTKEQAQNRAKTKNIPENKQRLIKVKINPKNVVRVDDVGRWTLSKYRNILQKLGLVSEERGVAKKEIKSFDDVLRVLKENNIDAFVYKNKFEGKGDSYIVFDNESLTQTEVTEEEAEVETTQKVEPLKTTKPNKKLKDAFDNNTISEEDLEAMTLYALNKKQNKKRLTPFEKRILEATSVERADQIADLQIKLEDNIKAQRKEFDDIRAQKIKETEVEEKVDPVVQEYLDELNKYRRAKTKNAYDLDEKKITQEQYEAENKRLNQELTATQKRLKMNNKKAGIDTRNEDWNKKIKENLPESNISTSEDLNKKLEEGTWGMLTAENPNADIVTDKQNENANKRAEKWLKSKGYSFTKIFGKYGNSEQSYLVDGLTREDAIEFAKEFSQESVATNEGLVYQDGSMNPKVGQSVNTNEKDLYSTIKTSDGLVDFKVDYDFSQRTEPTIDESEQAQAPPTIPPVTEEFDNAFKDFEGRPTLEQIYKKAEELGKTQQEARDYAKKVHKYTNEEIKDFVFEREQLDPSVAGQTIKEANNIFTKGAKKAIEFLDTIKRRLASAKGYLPKNVLIARETRDAHIQSEIKLAERAAKKLSNLMKGKSDEMYDKVDRFMRGEAVDLPIGIATVAQEMRNHIDALSTALVESGAITSGESATNIMNNIGEYMNRSYKLYDDKNYVDNISDEVINEAKEYLKKQFLVNVNEKAKEEGVSVEEYLKEELEASELTLEEYVEAKATQSVNDILKKSEANEFIKASSIEGKKDVKILKERKDIPAEIRALMGEYTDPAYNYVMSVAKIKSLVENQKYLSKIKDIGNGVFLFKEKDVRRPNDYVRISAEGNQSLEPLDGYFAPKEMVDQLMKGSNLIDTNSKTFEKIYETWLKAVGGVKYAKTILSVGTHAKNVLGNLYFMAQNGYVDPKEFNNAFKVLKNDFMGMTDEQLNEKLDEYVKAGIINQGVSIREVKEMLEGDDNFDVRVDKRISDKAESKRKTVLKNAKKKIKQAGQVAEDLYQAEDDMFKIVAYENEKKRYAKALKNQEYDSLSEKDKKEVDDIVIENVKNLLPNYSRLGGLAKGLRGFPVAGTFISFQLEAYRTAYNTIDIAGKEMKSENPEIRKIGAKRLASIVGFQAIKYGILSALGSAFAPEDEEPEDVMNIRPFLPPWSKNSDILVLQSGGGKFKYVDMSASDPYGGIARAINSISRGEDAVESFTGFLQEVSSPLGGDIFTSSLSKIINNQDSYGNPIYSAADTNQEKISKILNEFYKTFEPGTITSARKIIKVDDKLTETIGQFTGFRPREVDVKKQLSFGLRDIKEDVDAVNKIKSRAKYKFKDGEGTLQEYLDAIETVGEKQKENYKKANKLINASGKLGLPIYEPIQLMKSNKWSKKDRNFSLFYDTLNPGDD